MNVNDACIVLGVVKHTMTDNDINIAFARAVKLAHPDTGVGDLEGLDNAKKARDTLREFLALGGHQVCPRCFGKKKVMHSNGIMLVDCPVCKGSGE